MLHIKDIEAFARINEALSHAAPGSQPAAGTEPERPSAEVVQLVSPQDSQAMDGSADSVGGAGYDFDLAPKRPFTMAALFSRMMFGRR